MRPQVAGLTVALMLSLALPCTGEPPLEHGSFRASDLVEVIRVDPAIRLDIRYATAHNFLGVPLYHEARAFLQRPAADALARAEARLRRQGYGLVVFDAYRPWRITKLMWDRSREAWRRGGYVADPSQGSRHNRGCAVDLTLCDARTGKAVEMPTEYDDFTAAAHADAPLASAAARRHRAALQDAMRAEGFAVLAEEWWHFDYKDWRHYRIEDAPFEAVRAARPPAPHRP